MSKGLTIIFLLICSTLTLAQDKERKSRLFYLDVGRYTLHEDEPWGFTMNAEYGWELSPGLFFTTAGGFGAASPASDENQFSGTNFYNLLVGFDLTMGQDNLVSPHLGLNFGVIGEHGSITGATYNFQGGLQLKTSREKRNYVRLSIQLGKHGADDDTGEALRGPITNTIGYVHTF